MYKSTLADMNILDLFIYEDTLYMKLNKRLDYLATVFKIKNIITGEYIGSIKYHEEDYKTYDCLGNLMDFLIVERFVPYSKIKIFKDLDVLDLFLNGDHLFIKTDSSFVLVNGIFNCCTICNMEYRFNKANVGDYLKMRESAIVSFYFSLKDIIFGV